MFAAYVIVAQALGDRAGGSQTVPGTGGKGHGFDGDPSSPVFKGAGALWDSAVQMTDLLRFSWLREQGAPSRAGVVLPGMTGWFSDISMVFSFQFCVSG